MKRTLTSIVASAALLCAGAAPLKAAIPEWDPSSIMDALWDGEKPAPSPIAKPRTYTSRSYVREAQARRDMKLKIVELQLSGAHVVKYGIRKTLGPRYQFVIVYYPRRWCDPNSERHC
jgi:hypothetical protein